MKSKNLNIVILLSLAVFAGIIFIDKKRHSDSTSAQVDAEENQPAEVIDDTGRMLEGQMPLNWQDVSHKEAKEKSRTERLKVARDTFSPASQLSPAEFQNMRDEQLQALLMQAEQPYEDDDGEELTAERVEAIRARGDAIW